MCLPTFSDNFSNYFSKKRSQSQSDWIENIWEHKFPKNSQLDLYLNFAWIVHCAQDCFTNCWFVFRVMGMLKGEPLICFLPGFFLLGDTVRDYQQ